MSEEVVQAPAAAPPTVDPAARAAKEKASADKWAAKAVEAMNAGKSEPAEEAPAEKPRAKDGKFATSKEKSAVAAKPKVDPDSAVAKDVGKAEAKPADAAADKEPADKAEAQPELVGSLGKARRLAREGKYEEAAKLIDLPLDKIPGSHWAAWRRENAKKESQILEAHAVVKREREALEADARQIVSEFKPYVAAKKAYEAGDYEEFFKLTTGEDLNTFQRKALAKLHGAPSVAKDPAVLELRAQLEAERKERVALQQKLDQEKQQAEARKVHAEYVEGLKGRIAEYPDERVAAAAEKPWFVKLVLDERRKHYDPNTDTSITEEEAIERVFDEERLTVAQWRDLTGGLSSSGERAAGTLNRLETDRRANDVKRVAKAPTSLSRSATVEAAPERRRTEKESLAHWSGLASKFAAQGK